MFGERDYEASIRKLVTNFDLEGRVVLVGFWNAVAHELSNIDFLVHASTVPEPFGQVVVEGMAAGLPVIATAAGGPLEIITNDVDGLLTPPADVDALATAMRRLAADPELRTRLSLAAVVRSRDFGPETIGKAWMAVYQELAASHPQYSTGHDWAK